MFTHITLLTKELKESHVLWFRRKDFFISSEKCLITFPTNARDLWGLIHRWGWVLLFCRVTQMHWEKVLKNIFLTLGQKAQLCLPQFQQRRTDTCHVEWVCKLWAVCQGKVRAPILYPDLLALLLHVFCQCFSVQRSPEIIVLIAVVAALARTSTTVLYFSSDVEVLKCIWIQIYLSF